MWDFLAKLLDTADFQPGRTYTGGAPGLVWLLNVADLLIWTACLAIPAVLVYFVRRRQHPPFPWVFWMFGLFIVSCGFTHFMEVFTYYLPVYRVSAVLKILTALVSWATVLAL